MIQTTINLKGLDTVLKKLSKTDMQTIGMKVMELQANQINKKIDAHGRRYAPYTPRYAKRKGVSPSSVTLISNGKVRPKGGDRQAGHMLHEFGVIKVSRNSVTCGWTTPRNKAKAKGNYNTRPFIGLNEKSRRLLYKYIRTNLF